MNLAASIVFDSSYVECALVTADEVSRRVGVFDVLHLIYLNRGTEEDATVRPLIAAFRDACDGRNMPVHAIEVGNTLAEFSAHHFNNSIVYKPLVPALVSGTDFIFNLDAGILLGNDFDNYVREVATTLCQPGAPWVLAANTLLSQDNLSEAQLRLPHHEKYPTGAVLLFNTRQYAAANWSTRYLETYAWCQGELRYAEQELMALVSRGEELVDLPRKNQLKVCFLGDQVLNGSAACLPDSAADDCVYFKFAGSFKPWKYWVLDPDKAVYTRRRDRMEKTFPVSGHPVIEAHRASCLQGEWASGFLRAYDRYLASGTAARPAVRAAAGQQSSALRK